MILAFLRILTFVLATLPESANRLLAVALGDLVFFALPKRRRAILSNLSHAFPDRPHGWLVRMGRTSCHRMIEVGMIAIASPRFSTTRLQEMAQTDEQTRAVILEVFDDPRPLVIAFPHLGAWELAGAFLSFLERPPREIGCLYRPLDNPGLNAWLETTRSRFGIQMLSRKQGFSDAMGILRRGGAFVLLFDQNAGANGTLSLFFDRVCSSTNLPGLMAEKFKAGLVVFGLKRTAFWRYTIFVHRIDQPPENPDSVAAYLDAWLTQTLRADEDLCASWLWAHNRWKIHRDQRKRLGFDLKRSALPAKGVPRNERFFVRMPDSLENVVIALPLIRALRASRPDAAVTALSAPEFGPLLECCGLCETVLLVPPDKGARHAFFRSLVRRYPDVWIDFSGARDAGTEARLAGCPQRFGISEAGTTRNHINQTWIPPSNLSGETTSRLHVWEGFLRYFGLNGNLDLAPIIFSGLPQPLAGQSDDQRWIGLHVGTQTADGGRWPAAFWRRLIERLLETDSGWCVAMLGEAEDRIVANEIGADFPPDRFVNLVEKLGAVETAGAMFQCRLVVTANPAAMTLANGLGISTVALFGPLNPITNAPPFFSPAWILQPPGCPETGGTALAELPWEPVAKSAVRALRS